MPTATNTFSRLDTDSDDTTRPASAFVAGLNLALEPGYVQGLRGNLLVPGYVLATGGTTTALGGFADGSTATAVELLCHSTGAHRLVRYDPAGNGGVGTRTTLLEWAGLALAPGLVPQGGILDGLLLYLDANGAVRSVSLARAAAGEYTTALLTADPYALHLVKQPPVVVPQCTRRANTDPTDPRSTLSLTRASSWQFALRYRYVDGEVTPLGTYTEIVFRAVPTALPVGYNYIELTIAPPPPLVEVVEVLVRKDNELTFLVAAELRRVAGVFPVLFSFYGKTVGGAVTAAEQAKIAEALPPRVGVAAIAKSRVYVGDVEEGAAAGALRLNAAAFPGALLNAAAKQVFRADRVVGSAAAVTTYYALMAGQYPNADSYYQVVSYNAAANAYSLRYVVGDGSYAQTFPQVAGTTTTVTAMGSPLVEVAQQHYVYKTFKESSEYGVGLQFYDAQGRPRNGVIVAENSPVFIPARAYAPPVIINEFGPVGPAENSTEQVVVATLAATTSAEQTAEIPEWAETYAICLSQNKFCSFFLQLPAADVRVFAGYNAQQVPQLQPLTVYSGTGPLPFVSQKLWVDIGGYVSGANVGAKIGYTWQPKSGDYLRFVDTGLSFAITGQTGDYLEVDYNGPVYTKTRDGGVTLGPMWRAFVEVFSPRYSTDSLTYYEATPRYPVVRTGTGPTQQRTYAQRSLTVLGDCALLYRQTYIVAPSPYAPPVTKTYDLFRRGAQVGDAATIPAVTLVEAMNFFDDSYSTWLDVSRARPAYAVPGGSKQVRRRSLVRFSGVKVSGTQLNGTGSWEALNQYDKLPQEQGAVTRLVVADQNASDGSILLALQEFGAVSLYLGQQPIQADANTQLIAITNQVIGGDNSLKGGFGCQDKASVVGFAGKVFYWCRERQELVRYHNGQTALGETYTARTRLQALARQYAGGTVSGCFDPHRQEYLLTFQPFAALPGTTLVWSERHGAWADAVSALPEAGLGVGNELVTWQAGQLWRHRPTAPVGNFFGLYLAPTLTFVAANPGGLLAKVWRAIGLVGPGRWVPVLLTAPDGAASRVLPQWLAYVQGVWRAALRRNENTAGPGTLAQKLSGGRLLQSRALTVTLQHPPGTDPAPLTAATLDFTFVTGQQGNG